MCIAMGGTISGEHGVGIEKRPMMSELFAPEDLEAMGCVRDAFDREHRLNPGKILPGGTGCGEAAAARAARAGAPALIRSSPSADPNAEGPWI